MKSDRKIASIEPATPNRLKGYGSKTGRGDRLGEFQPIHAATATAWTSMKRIDPAKSTTASLKRCAVERRATAWCSSSEMASMLRFATLVVVAPSEGMGPASLG